MDVSTVSPAALDALSVSTRRVALAVLADSGVTMSIDALASAVASRAVGSDTVEDADAVRDTLFHVDLPTLADAGAVTFDPETGLVAAAADPPFERAWVERLIADHPESAYDPVLSALASERRQALLYELFTEGPATEAELAGAVAAHERESHPETVPETVSRVVGLSLVHTHVPVLAEAGLVARDPATDVIRADATAWRSDPWVDASPIGEWAAAE